MIQRAFLGPTLELAYAATKVDASDLLWFFKDLADLEPAMSC